VGKFTFTILKTSKLSKFCKAIEEMKLDTLSSKDLSKKLIRKRKTSQSPKTPTKPMKKLKKTQNLSSQNKNQNSKSLLNQKE